MAREYETIYSPFTPIHHYTPQAISQLPRKHDIIDLKRVLEQSAPPEEIKELVEQVYLKTDEYKKADKARQEAEERANAADQLKDEVFEKFTKLKVEHEKYKKDKSNEIKILMDEIDAAKKESSSDSQGVKQL